jgi:hypothetical protein
MPGTITISTLSDGTNSTSATNPILGSARAWVNFNGTGTPAIRASYNVSSITDNGTGDYTINFTNAFADANYAFVGGIRNDPAAGSGANAQITGATTTAQTTTQLRVTTGTPTLGTLADYSTICVSIFR